MKLARVSIRNYRAVRNLDLRLDPSLTVFHGDNAHGKTSILSAIAVGLGSIPKLLPEVSGINFLKTDRRRWQSVVEVMLTTTGGIEWRRAMGSRRKAAVHRQLSETIEKIVKADREGVPKLDLPIIAFYDTDRAVFEQTHRWLGFKTEFSRYAALEGALSARTDFRDFFKWFYAKENEELRWQKEQRDLDFRLPELDAVRRAMKSMVPSVSDPRIESGPLRFVVSVQSEPGLWETVSLDQLSGGCRIVLALAADLARRMVQGNPHLEDPLASDAIVLIDEIELHLHPSWQQRVLPDLERTFPNAQFIVSTQSPQVLTSVRPEHVVGFNREGDDVVALPANTATYGAKAGYVLSSVMGVNERPRNRFKQVLDLYAQLISDGQGESQEALTLRQKLNELSPRDPGLDRADIDIRRHRVLSGMRKCGDTWHGPAT